MNISERVSLNKQKMAGLQERLTQLETEKQELLQEALRTDGQIQLLNELLKEEQKDA